MPRCQVTSTLDTAARGDVDHRPQTLARPDQSRSERMDASALTIWAIAIAVAIAITLNEARRYQNRRR